MTRTSGAGNEAAELAAKERLGKLTPTERGVLRLIFHNKTTQDIASELSISPKTVENHRSKICQKLEVTGNNALMRFVLSNAGVLKEL